MTKLNRRQFSALSWSTPLWAFHSPRFSAPLPAESTVVKGRGEILFRMELVMGPFPEGKPRPSLDMRILGRADTVTISRWKISYVSEEGGHAPAYLLRPKKLQGRVPGILSLHQTTELGAAEPAGLGGNPNYHYAEELAERGCVTLAPDYPDLPFGKGFGGYRSNAYRRGYQSQTMKGIWNHVRAVDLLRSMSEVDPQHLRLHRSFPGWTQHTVRRRVLHSP